MTMARSKQKAIVGVVQADDVVPFREFKAEPSQPAVAMRPKTGPELMAEWQEADDQARMFSQSILDLAAQKASLEQQFEDAMARRTAAAQAIQDRIGVAR